MFKRYLSLFLSFIITLSCFTYVFNAEVSVANRTIDLFSYQQDGSYANTNNIESGIYGCNLAKSTISLNKIKVAYTVDTTAFASDLPQTIKIAIPKATIDEDAKVETNYTDVIGNDISISYSFNNVVLSIPINREVLINKDIFNFIIPFTLTSIDIDNPITVTLISANGQSINYNWTIGFYEVSDSELTLPERLQANTIFNLETLKANTGMQYTIPITIQSIADETNITVSIENPNFYFKTSTGSWSSGSLDLTIDKLQSGIPLQTSFEVFCLTNAKSPFIMKVDGSSIDTLEVSADDLTIDYTGTTLRQVVNNMGKIKLSFHYTEEQASDNTFKFNILNYDSASYIINQETADISVDNEKKTVTFTADYTPKVVYNNKPLQFSVTTSFNDDTYNLIESTVYLTSLKDENDEEGDINEIDCAIDSFGSLSTIYNNQEKETFVQILNQSDTEVSTTLLLSSNNDKVVLESVVQGWTTTNPNKYTVPITIGSHSIVRVPFFVVTDKLTNTTNSKLPVNITATLDLDDLNTSNNSSTLSLFVLPDEQKPDESEYNLNDYFNIEFTASTIKYLEPVVITATLKQKQIPPKTLTDGILTLEVVGDVKEQTNENNYSVSHNISDILADKSGSITFTPTNIGSYKVKALVTCDNLSTGGELESLYNFDVISEDKLYPDSPLVSSDAITMECTLSNITDNKGTLTLKVTNNTDYILRNAYLNFDYSDILNITNTGRAIIRDDTFIDDLPPKTTKTFIYNVELLKSGLPDIIISLKSQDINNNVFTPSVSYNTYLEFTEDNNEPVLYSIAGTVFNDINANNLFDAEDNVISNATVYLCEKVGNILKTVRTFTSGYYSFENVSSGTYVLKVEYLGNRYSKEVYIDSNSLVNCNLPLIISNEEDNDNIPDNSGDSNNSNNNGNSSVSKSDLLLTYELVDITNDYYNINLIIKNISATPAIFKIRVNSNPYSNIISDILYNTTNGYTTNYSTLAPLQETTMNLKVMKNKTNTNIDFICDSTNDYNLSNNSVLFTMLAKDDTINETKPNTDDDFWANFEESGNTENNSTNSNNINISDTIVDFISNTESYNKPNTPNTQDVSHNTNTEVLDTPESQQGVIQYTSKDSINNTLNTIPSLPLTGRNNSIDILTDGIDIALAYGLGVLFLCFTLYQITLFYKKNN